MAKIILLEKDMKILKLMEDAVKTEEAKKDPSKGHEFTCFNDILKVGEALNKDPYNLVFADATLIPGTLAIAIQQFRKAITLPENKEIPLVLLSPTSDITYMKKIMNIGLMDVIVKPIDIPIFKQKFSLFTGSTSSANQLYSLQVGGTVGVAFYQKLEQVSEFGLTVRTGRAPDLSEFVTLHSDMFGNNTGKAEVVARCYKVTPHPADAKEFQAHFVFVGVSDDTQRYIRTWLRQEYVKKKQTA